MHRAERALRLREDLRRTEGGATGHDKEEKQWKTMTINEKQ